MVQLNIHWVNDIELGESVKLDGGGYVKRLKIRTDKGERHEIILFGNLAHNLIPRHE